MKMFRIGGFCDFGTVFTRTNPLLRSSVTVFDTARAMSIAVAVCECDVNMSAYVPMPSKSNEEIIIIVKEKLAETNFDRQAACVPGIGYIYETVRAPSIFVAVTFLWLLRLHNSFGNFVHFHAQRDSSDILPFAHRWLFLQVPFFFVPFFFSSRFFLFYSS